MSIEKQVASLDQYQSTIDMATRRPRRGKRFPRAPRPPGVPATEAKASPRTHRVRVDDLLPGDSPRLAGESAEHIRVLAESGDRLPPILVHRPTMSVVDGAHRVLAVRLRGEETIEARFLDGTEEEAFLDAVRANMAHGLPLSLADREAAASRVIEAFPHWSDKAVAEVVGLAPGTVAGIRRRSDAGAAVAVRVGRDGRARPVDWARGRIAAGQIIARRPEASLREVAREAGVSPATVRDVRARLQRGEEPVPAGWRFGDAPPARRDATSGSVPSARPSDPVGTSHGDDLDAPGAAPPAAAGRLASLRPAAPADRHPSGTADQRPAADDSLGGQPSQPEFDPRAVLELLRADPTLRYSESGRAAWRWLYSHAAGLADWNRVVESIPPHCAYQLSGMARRCAEDWLAFAERLDRRAEAQG